MDTKSIICTIGPASVEARILRRLQALGVKLFRINLSHTPLEEVGPTIAHLQKNCSVPICLDSEGAQVRTGAFEVPSAVLTANSYVDICRLPIKGTAQRFNFVPDVVFDLLHLGDVITIDFNVVVAQVIRIESDKAVLRILNGGEVRNSKAVTIQREINLPAISQKDRKAIQIGLEMGVKHFALSFANKAEDVRRMRELTGPDATIISKIESRSGIANLEEITRLSDGILIDRGDLSRQVALEQIPAQQKSIIRQAKALGRPVFVATNLLESMVTSRVPTRAEVNDIYNTLADGADGLVLAAETAIGCHPIQCVSLVSKIISEYARAINGDMPRLLPSVRENAGATAENDQAKDKSPHLLKISNTDLIDAEQIALGVYQPLTGFMNRETLESVLEKNQLPDGTPWPLPIVLQITPNGSRFTAGDELLLSADGNTQFVMKITEHFQYDPRRIVKQWFGTSSTNHPGVARILSRGSNFLAGDVLLMRRAPTAFVPCLLTPLQTKFVFNQRGWERVVGFNARRILHREDEYMQIEAFRSTEADGLYLSLINGPNDAQSFRAQDVLKSYEACLEASVYPREQTMLAGFASYPRHAGPRESVFTAICHKNIGCTHFVVEHNSENMGGLYEAKNYHRLFEEIGEIGIEPIFFDKIGYDAELDSYGESSSLKSLAHISDVEICEALKNGNPLPKHLIRDCVAEALRPAS